MATLSTGIGGIKMDTCVMNASGCWCTTQEELDALSKLTLGAIVSKSSTLLPRSGNQLPRLYSDDYGSINSMGIPNLGYEFYAEYGCQRIIGDKPFIQSIYPFSTDELNIMIKNIPQRIPLELNVSCPNLASVSNDFERLSSYLDRIQQSGHSHLWGLKLAPLYELQHFDIVASMLVRCEPLRWIVCSNSIVNGLIINPLTETTRIRPKGGLGGIGGMYIKPTALANIYNFHTRLGDKIDIIGCGGVYTGTDVFEHLLCGAKAVQIGSCLVNEGPECFNRIQGELLAIMTDKHYDTIEEFRGKLKVIEI